MTIRVFVAFDMDHDQDLCNKMIASAGGTAIFEVSGTSEPRVDPETWARTTQAHIAESEQIVVVCGAHTEGSVSVAAELRMARLENKPVILLWSRREIMCQKPVGALPVDSMYSWTSDILESQLATNRRNALRMPVPGRSNHQHAPAPDGRRPLPRIAPGNLT